MLADLHDHVRQEGFGQVDQRQDVRVRAGAGGVAGGRDGDVLVDQHASAAHDQAAPGESARGHAGHDRVVRQGHEVRIGGHGLELVPHRPPPKIHVISDVEEHGDEWALDVDQVLQTRRVHRSSPFGSHEWYPKGGWCNLVP